MDLMSCTCLSGNRSKPGFWYRVLVRYRIAETCMDTGFQPHHINPISINKAAPKKIKRCDLEVGVMSGRDSLHCEFFPVATATGRYCIGFGDLRAVAQRMLSARCQRDSAVQLSAQCSYTLRGQDGFGSSSTDGFMPGHTKTTWISVKI